MMLGWSVLCRDYGRLVDGSVILHKVFADTTLALSLPRPGPDVVPLSSPFALVSYWYKESDAESRTYPAVLRVSAPGDNRIIGEMQFEIDLLQSDSSFVTFQFRRFRFVSDGIYEFQIEVPEFGDWEVTSHNSVNIVGNVP